MWQEARDLTILTPWHVYPYFFWFQQSCQSDKYAMVFTDSNAYNTLTSRDLDLDLPLQSSAILQQGFEDDAWDGYVCFPFHSDVSTVATDVLVLNHQASVSTCWLNIHYFGPVSRRNIIHRPPILWNNLTSTSAVPCIRWKSMSTSTEVPWQYTKDPLMKFYGRPSLLSSVSQRFQSRVQIPPIAQCVAVVLITYNCELPLHPNYHIKSKVTIMPTNTRPVIIEIIVWLSGRGLSPWEILRINGVFAMPVNKMPYSVFVSTISTD